MDVFEKASGNHPTQQGLKPAEALSLGGYQVASGNHPTQQGLKHDE